jgi:hypothetical protein
MQWRSCRRLDSNCGRTDSAGIDFTRVKLVMHEY